MKGQKGIRILAPMIGSRKKKDTEATKDAAAVNTPVLVGFRAVYVFDRLSRDVKGGVKVDQCGGAKGSHLGPEKAAGIAGARASGA